MNRRVRSLICFLWSTLAFGVFKLFHPNSFSWRAPATCSPRFSIYLDRGCHLSLGKHFCARGGTYLYLSNGGRIEIGDDVSFNHNCMVVAQEHITIGNGVEFGPGVMIYDHDHDVSNRELRRKNFHTAPVVVGNGVWIGANTVILRGTEIGDHSVVGAGCVLKGRYPADSVIIQKRNECITEIGGLRA